MNYLLVFSLAALLGADRCDSLYSRYNTHTKNGYGDIRLDDSTYKITFYGPAGQTGDVIQDLALLHAAEVTLEAGVPYFTVLRDDGYAESAQVFVPEERKTEVSKKDSSVIKTQIIQKARQEQRNWYNAILTIRVYRSKPSAQAFTAEYLIASIRRKYGIRAPEEEN